MPEAEVLRLRPETRGTDGQALVALERVVLERAGKRLLDGLDLALDGEGVTALMGPNGAGKSLTLRVIAGLVAPTSGRAVLDPAVEGAVALVFQKPVLLRRSVRANLDHALRIYGVPRQDRPGRIAELLVMGDLARLAERPARSLSGGEQQRLAMVRALASEPRLLLLDEPTASLDPRATAAIEQLVHDAARRGVRVVLVTHDRGQAQRLADEVAFLNRGRLAEQTRARSFFQHPASPEAAAYLDGRLLL